MDFAVVLCLYILVLILDFIPFLSKGTKKEKWFFLATIIFTFPLLVLDSLNITVPSPAILIKFIINSIL